MKSLWVFSHCNSITPEIQIQPDFNKAPGIAAENKSVASPAKQVQSVINPAALILSIAAISSTAI